LSFVSLPSPFLSKAVASSPKSPVPSASQPRATGKPTISANTTPTDVLNGSCRAHEVGHLRHALGVSAGRIQVSFNTKYRDSGTECLQFDPRLTFFSCLILSQLDMSLASPLLLFTYRTRPQQLPPYHTALTYLVIVHTIFIRHLLVSPPNIVTQLRMHISAPTNTTLAALLRSFLTFNRFY
jgi:hypothetical protein